MDITSDEYYYQDNNFMTDVLLSTLRSVKDNGKIFIEKEKLTMEYSKNNMKINFENLPQSTKTLFYVHRCRRECEFIIDTLFVEHKTVSLPDPLLFAGIVFNYASATCTNILFLKNADYDDDVKYFLHFNIDSFKNTFQKKKLDAITKHDIKYLVNKLYDHPEKKNNCLLL